MRIVALPHDDGFVAVNDETIAAHVDRVDAINLTL